MRTSIDEWESKLINENLARGIGGGHLNNYWIVKNMMGPLIEEMVSTWNYIRNSVLQEKPNLIQLGTHLNRWDAAAPWK